MTQMNNGYQIHDDCEGDDPFGLDAFTEEEMKEGQKQLDFFRQCESEDEWMKEIERIQQMDVCSVATRQQKKRSAEQASIKNVTCDMLPFALQTEGVERAKEFSSKLQSCHEDIVSMVKQNPRAFSDMLVECVGRKGREIYPVRNEINIDRVEEVMQGEEIEVKKLTPELWQVGEIFVKRPKDVAVTIHSTKECEPETLLVAALIFDDNNYYVSRKIEGTPIIVGTMTPEGVGDSLQLTAMQVVGGQLHDVRRLGVFDGGMDTKTTVYLHLAPVASNLHLTGLEAVDKTNEVFRWLIEIAKDPGKKRPLFFGYHHWKQLPSVRRAMVFPKPGIRPLMMKVVRQQGELMNHIFADDGRWYDLYLRFILSADATGRQLWVVGQRQFLGFFFCSAMVDHKWLVSLGRRLDAMFFLSQGRVFSKIKVTGSQKTRKKEALNLCLGAVPGFTGWMGIDSPLDYANLCVKFGGAPMKVPITLGPIPPGHFCIETEAKYKKTGSVLDLMQADQMLPDPLSLVRIVTDGRIKVGKVVVGSWT